MVALNPIQPIDLEFVEATTWNLHIDYTDSSGTAIDLTGYEAKMVLRAGRGSTTVYATLTDTAGITLGSGTIDVTISAATTDAFTFRECYYNLLIKSGGGEVTEILEGTILNRENLTTL